MIRLEKQDYLGKSKDELIEDLFEKIRENEKLKRKLRKYENPHTPPSKDERVSCWSNSHKYIQAIDIWGKSSQKSRMDCLTGSRGYFILVYTQQTITQKDR